MCVAIRWETNADYCKNEVITKSPYNNGPRLLDIMDTSVLDYLMGKSVCVSTCVSVYVCELHVMHVFVCCVCTCVYLHVCICVVCTQHFIQQNDFMHPSIAVQCTWL